MLGKSEDLSQRTDNKDLAVATLLAGADFDPIKERTDDFDSLQACGLIIQNLLQSGDLPAIEVRKIGMDRNFGVAWLGYRPVVPDGDAEPPLLVIRREHMKTHYFFALAMLVGFTFGAVAVQGLQG